MLESVSVRFAVPDLRPDRLLSTREVLDRTGMSKSTLHRLVRKRAFPAPVMVGARTKWRESAVLAWQAEGTRVAGGTH